MGPLMSTNLLLLVAGAVKGLAVACAPHDGSGLCSSTAARGKRMLHWHRLKDPGSIFTRTSATKDG